MQVILIWWTGFRLGWTGPRFYWCEAIAGFCWFGDGYQVLNDGSTGFENGLRVVFLCFGDEQVYGYVCKMFEKMVCIFFVNSSVSKFLRLGDWLLFFFLFSSDPNVISLPPFVTGWRLKIYFLPSSWPSASNCYI